MARLRRRPATPRPPDSAIELAQVASAQVQAVEDTADSSAIDRNSILAEFEAALREQPGLDQEGFKFLMGHLREAVENAPLQPELADLDHSAWMETFDAIVGDELDEDERNALIRQLRDAVDPLNSSSVQIAAEFAKHVQNEGEVAALDWLKEQRKAAQSQAGVSPPVDRDSAPERQSITRSRSRRLRGPPA